MKTLVSITCVGLFLVAGCGGPKSGKGFTLPDGDVSNGQAVFVSMQCSACHTVAGIDRPQLPEDEKYDVTVKLGGEVPRIKTYGQLVTSIVNPSHKLATGYPHGEIATGEASKMRNYNDVMTVTELIDLVSFLQSKYELEPYDPTEYPM